jgi:hypothetical protein
MVIGDPDSNAENVGVPAEEHFLTTHNDRTASLLSELEGGFSGIIVSLERVDC